MRLVTWNVNSLKARLQRVLEFLAQHAPDVVCLQGRGPRRSGALGRSDARPPVRRQRQRGQRAGRGTAPLAHRLSFLAAMADRAARLAADG
jgi:hypothetical protein